MNKSNIEILAETIIKDEGMRLKPYRCTAGKLTIGVGRNIEDNGISEGEALILLSNDITACIREVSSLFGKHFSLLTQPRQNVLINMAFQLGITRLRKFKKLRKAIANYDYDEASKEMLDSKWAKLQTPERANRLAEEMRKG